MQDENKKVFLTLKLNKSNNAENNEKYFIFDVEASNENLDLEDQKILQRALLDSKEYFLSNGVISKDHLHQKIVGEGINRKLIYDEDFIIGEPLEVYTKGSVTRVKGKLYRKNKYAQKFINLLEEGSSRVKASVGGLLPIVRKAKEDGKEVEKVVSMLWNDLALTISPVNHTVGGAYIIERALNGLVLKALSAGYGTDSAKFTGGRALVPEDLEGTNKINHINDVLLLFLSEIEKGKIKNKKEAESFLLKIDTKKKHSLNEIIKMLEDNKEMLKEVLPMTSWEEMFPFLKKSNENTKVKEKGEDEKMIKDDDIDENQKDEFEDATPVLKSLSDSIIDLNNKIETLSKSLTGIQKDQEVIGQALTVNVEMLSKILGTPNPRKSVVNSLDVINKSTASNSNMKKRHKQFSKEDLKIISPILSEFVKKGEIGIMESGIIEGQINKSIQDPTFQIDQQYITFLEKKLNKIESI